MCLEIENKVAALAHGDSCAIASSILGNEVNLRRYNSGGTNILLIGGVHGDESEGFLLAERFEQELFKQESLGLDPGISLYLCPRLNPDGCIHKRRTNQNNVDLNRNLPTKDWVSTFTNVRYYPGPKAGSEIETQLTVRLVEILRPKLILSLHSYERPMVNYNGDAYCKALAEAMARLNHIPAKGDIGYPTPGSLGTYAGWERNIPTITLEILRGQAPSETWEQHRSALVCALHYPLEHPNQPL